MKACLTKFYFPKHLEVATSTYALTDGLVYQDYLSFPLSSIFI